MKTLIESALKASRVDDSLRYWKNVTPYHKEVCARRKALALATMNFQMKTAGRS